MTITTLTRKTALTGTGVLAALALAACGTTADNGDDGSASPEPDASSAVASTPATDDASTTSASASASASTQSSAWASSTTAAAGSGSATGQADDPADGVIDAVLEEHGDGIIVAVDADDDTTWEVDVVVGEEVKELDVTADGDITETDRESDPEDVQKAKEAEVTAQQALDTARAGRDGVTLDEMDLDDDNGTLQWEVAFDREDGSDGPELEIDATSGEVLTVDER